MTHDNLTHRPAVSVLGLGLMGAALAKALLDAGHPTTVWNRSTSKADPLVAAGATRAETVAEAVAASPLTIACVLDHAALHDMLDPVAGDLSGRALVNLTSSTPEEARATAAWAAENHVEYLDGKILALPSTVGSPDAFLLFSGPPDVFTTHEPTLAVLGDTDHLGPDPGLASLYDLGLVGVMFGTITGFLHSLAVLRAEAVDAGDFLPYATQLIGALPAMVADIADQVQTGEYGGRDAQLNMQAVFVGHMVEVSEARGVDPAFPAYVKGLMDRAIARDHGRDDVGRLLEGLTVPARAA